MMAGRRRRRRTLTETAAEAEADVQEILCAHADVDTIDSI
jgi:hypothetical protein